MKTARDSRLLTALLQREPVWPTGAWRCGRGEHGLQRQRDEPEEIVGGCRSVFRPDRQLNHLPCECRVSTKLGGMGRGRVGYRRFVTLGNSRLLVGCITCIECVSTRSSSPPQSHPDPGSAEPPWAAWDPTEWDLWLVPPQTSRRYTTIPPPIPLSNNPSARIEETVSTPARGWQVLLVGSVRAGCCACIHWTRAAAEGRSATGFVRQSRASSSTSRLNALAD